jgi:hypothetical protein
MHTSPPGIEDGGMAHGSGLDRFVAAQIAGCSSR